MSKVFVNQNPQQPAPVRPLRYDGPRGRANGGQLRQALFTRPKNSAPRQECDTAVFVMGLVVLGLLVFALVTWWKQVVLFAAVFVALGLFARSPILAIGGALLLLLAAR